MSETDRIREREQRFHMRTYGRLPVAFVRGEGSRLWDAEGKEYLDFLGGIAVMSVGHSHPRVLRAIGEQAARLQHVSNLFYTEPQSRLAQRLHELAGWGRVFFSNSGAEANECAIKLSRRWTSDRAGAPRSGVVSALGSFHGRTVATLAATGQPHKHERFLPLPPEFTNVPFGDEAALDRAVDDRTSAVILETVQGEGGVVPAAPEYLAIARKLCDERGALLIFDEVQTGLGRTGRWFGFEHAGIVPDVFTLAKALGAGLPIGACVAREEVADAFRPGDHATTFGGGPIPCAAALEVLGIIEDEGLVENAHAMGERLTASLHAALEGNPAFREVRGAGLLLGVVLAGEWAREIVLAALDRGLVVNDVAPDVIRLAPPLILTPQEADRGAAILAELIAGYGERAR